MFAQFGNALIIFALITACLQFILPSLGEWQSNIFLRASARPLAFLQCFLVLAAYSLLTVAFIRNDFSLAYVAANSHPSLPLMYRFTAVWGAHEGSILLWILMLNIWTIAYVVMAGKSRNAVLTTAILGLCSAAFLIFLYFTSNPFMINPYQTNGLDLNPLLQDVGFVIHPPMLYLGYVGFATAFAITLAALINQQLDHVWVRTTRQFATAAWSFLTFGIMLGSWWAYRVLGWGGFWFWDPVENASLLPWIAGLSLLHVLIVVEKRQIAIKWAVSLALVCFLLSLLGTFLVRSGLLISAHTFASDPARGVFLLLILGILCLLALAFFIKNFPRIKSSTDKINLCSREMALISNSALLFLAMLTILLGTIYPLILDALHLSTVSVGAPYFNSMMAPLLLFNMVLMAIGVKLRWQQQERSVLLKIILPQMFAAIIIAGLVLYLFAQQFNLLLLINLTIANWVVLSVLKSFRFLPSMALGHIGFACVVIGILLSSHLSIEKNIKMKPGDAVNIGPYQFFFLNTSGVTGSNYRGIRAEFEVMKKAHHITNLYPEKRIYLVRDMVMTNVAIHPGLFRDLYLALGEPLDHNYWSLRIYYKPFIRFIWLGGCIMMLSGLFALLNRRSRP